MDSDDERDGEDDGKDDVILSLSLSLFRPLAIRPFCERKVQWRNCFKACCQWGETSVILVVCVAD